MYWQHGDSSPKKPKIMFVEKIDENVPLFELSSSPSESIV